MSKGAWSEVERMILLLVAEEVERLVLCRSEGDSYVFLCIRLCRIACLMDRTSDDGYLLNI